MKKLIFSCVVLVNGMVCLVGCASKDAVKKQFMDSCLSTVPGNIPKDLAKTYCACSADKMLEKYSVTEIWTMDQKFKDGDERAKAEMMKVIQPCIDDLTKSVAEQQAGK